MRQVLVTGGAGFIGSALTLALVARGDAVVAVDNLFSGSRENLQAVSQSKRFKLVIGDIRDEALMEEYTSTCDTVIHLAALVGLKVVISNPLETLDCNVRGTEVVLRSAARHGCRTIVASSSELYGLSTRFPSSESDPITFGAPTKLRWSYACSKAIDEFFALTLARERNLPATVVRLFNTVGPRQSARYGMVLPRFVRQALDYEPLTVYGDGTQTRCFCYVGDVVDAVIAMLDEKATIGEIFNVGNPQEIAIRDLACRVIQHSGSSSSLRFIPFDEAYECGFEDITRRVPDISKIRAAIGFEPRTSIDDAIVQVIESVRQRQPAA
ncbi:MAG: NAD-dependent epimerase/dehydratase family protein [Candidatus Tumulicola sp.]